MTTIIVTNPCLKMWPHYIVISFRTFSKFKEGQFQQCLVFYTLFLKKIQEISRLLIPKMRIHLGVLWPVPLFFHIYSCECVWVKGCFDLIFNIFLLYSCPNLCHEPKVRSTTMTISKNFFKICWLFCNVLQHFILLWFYKLHFTTHITFF